MVENMYQHLSYWGVTSRRLKWKLEGSSELYSKVLVEKLWITPPYRVRVHDTTQIRVSASRAINLRAIMHILWTPAAEHSITSQ